MNSSGSDDSDDDELIRALESDSDSDDSDEGEEQTSKFEEELIQFFDDEDKKKQFKQKQEQEKMVNKEIFKMAFNVGYDYELDKNKTILRKTKKFLRWKVDPISSVDRHYPCYAIQPPHIQFIEFCHPKCPTQFGLSIKDCKKMRLITKIYKCKKLTKQQCYEIGLDPHLFLCKRGIFHVCSQMCPGDCPGIRQDNICFKTGVTKSHMFSSFDSKNEDDIISANIANRRKKIKRTNSNGERQIRRFPKTGSKMNEEQKKNFSEINKDRYQDAKIRSKCIDDEINEDYFKRLQLINEASIPMSPFQPINPKIIFKRKIKKKNRLKKSTKLLINMKKITWTKDPFMVIRKFTLQEPIQIHNDTSKKKNKKLKRSFKFPIYILDRELYDFLTSKVTLEQLSIQFGTLSFYKVFKKMAYEYFQGNTKQMKEFLHRHGPIIKSTENVILRGLLPGLARLERQMEYFKEYYRFLMAHAKQYIAYCRRGNGINRIPIDIQFHAHLTDFNAQQHNVVNLHDYMMRHDTPEKEQEFWDSRTNLKTHLQKPNYTEWPTWKFLKEIIPQVIAIDCLVKDSHSNKNKRKTVDPTEMALGALCCLRDGVFIYKQFCTHEQYIPKIKQLDKSGVFLYLNELRKILKIRGISKSHIQGERTIRNAMEWYNENGISGKEIMDYIQSFNYNSFKSKKKIVI